MNPTLQCPCTGAFVERTFTYDAPPAGETRFAFAGEYRRGYGRCSACGHWFAAADMDLTGLYVGDYVDQTYGDRMQRTFERIIALPPAQSDNAGRIARLQAFAERRFGATRTVRLLDVGAGLGVFPHAVKHVGWHCTALDPDARAVVHLREHVGVDAVQGDFMHAEGLGRFDVITFNKVLEHVADPVAMLARARAFLADGGFVYVELPDGELAAVDGPEREEFFVEHLHVFSAASIALLAANAGFVSLVIERLREPSGKYTLRAFIEAAGT